MGLPWWLSGKESAFQCRRRKRCSFHPWSGKIPWRTKWQPTPEFLPGESHGQRSLAGYSPWGSKESSMTEQLGMMSLISQKGWKKNFLIYLLKKASKQDRATLFSRKMAVLHWKSRTTQECPALSLLCWDVPTSTDWLSLSTDAFYLHRNLSPKPCNKLLEIII